MPALGGHDYEAVSVAERIAIASDFGAVSGALRFLPSENLGFFSYLTVRRAMIDVLRLAGFTSIENQLPSWISGCGGPPALERATCPPQLVVHVLLSHLSKNSSTSIAEAASRTRRLAPHMHRGPEISADLGQEAEEVQMALREAALLMDSVPHGQPDPLGALFDLLSEARGSSIFAPMQGGEISFATPQGLVVTRLPGHVAHHWALGLLAGEALHRKGYLSQSVPLASILSAEMLRSDLSRSDRVRAYYRQVRGALRGVQEDIAQALRLARSAAASLNGRRSTSRSVEVYAAIAGLGGLRRSQVMHGFELSPRGVEIVLGPLKAGLIEQDHRMAPFTASLSSSRRKQSNAGSELPTVAYSELNDAISDLDRLLEKFGG